MPGFGLGCRRCHVGTAMLQARLCFLLEMYNRCSSLCRVFLRLCIQYIQAWHGGSSHKVQKLLTRRNFCYNHSELTFLIFPGVLEFPFHFPTVAFVLFSTPVQWFHSQFQTGINKLSREKAVVSWGCFDQLISLFGGLVWALQCL